MFETIREVALERLHASGEAEQVRRRHADGMLAIARSAHPSEDAESDVAAVLAKRQDPRAELDWAQENYLELGLEIADELQSLWNASGPDERMRRLERLLDGAGAIPPELRARPLRVYVGQSLWLATTSKPSG